MKAFLVFMSLFLFMTETAKAQPVNEFKPVVYEEPVQNFHPFAPNTQRKRTYIEEIVWRNRLRCGSNLSISSFASYEDGVWTGIDADICRAIAQAILGDSTKIEMVNIAPKDVTKALDSGKIDVMLSGLVYSAKTETSREAMSAGLLYYDHQMLMVPEGESDDLENYRGKKICISTDADYFKNFDDYNMRYGLGITYLTFNSLKQAKEAYMLKRCQMMTASGLMLNGILKDLPASKAKILPVHIAMHPVYAFVQRDNNELRLAIKWILNALFLAEQYDISSQNMSFFATNDDPEIRNLLGDDETLWTDLKLKPRWVREIVSAIGNYGDIYEKNLGESSDYHLKREEGRLVKNGGTVCPVPFM